MSFYLFIYLTPFNLVLPYSRGGIEVCLVEVVNWYGVFFLPGGMQTVCKPRPDRQQSRHGVVLPNKCLKCDTANGHASFCQVLDSSTNVDEHTRASCIDTERYFRESYRAHVPIRRIPLDHDSNVTSTAKRKEVSCYYSAVQTRLGHP
ncbi:hypothetical protein EDB81DRAFT_477055 [Dactylonectria macrodidyma]|uniref:Uncharacterized protein n=1 Tax=Dactylonectria macrodidyma TaxID=307937 RepID=A0A9P9F094_9HYPO|nr:hypothetical protein EDB81DRAFT_477055 [Dactylonectria macrodidyma]